LKKVTKIEEGCFSFLSVYRENPVVQKYKEEKRIFNRRVLLSIFNVTERTNRLRIKRGS
jgi:hypothetical protein